MISRSRALRQWYVGETRGFLHTTDAGVATLIWVIGISCLLVLVGTAMAQAFDYQTQRGQLDMLDATKKQMTTMAAHAYARILPALDSRGQSNCSAGWCRELVLYTREADNVDRYVAWDFDGSKIQQYRFTALGADGSHQGLSAVGKPVPASGFQVRVDAASQLATDTANPYASFLGSVFSSAGMTPNDVAVNFGKPLTVGKNDVVFVHMWNASVGDDFALSPVTLATTDLSLTVGFYKPTPPPGLGVGGINGPSGLVYHYPGDPSGPSSFQVSENYYHDAFFAEQGSCGGVAAPNPNYVPGSSQTYYPKSSFGSSGPWVYPNPNPVSPPGQGSGPGTFGVVVQNPGYCSMGLYDVYENRAGAAKAQVSVQVMGPLRLAVSTLVFTTPTSAPQGDSVSKTFDNDAIQVGSSGCGGIAALSMTSQTTPGSVNSSPARTGFSVYPSGGGYGSCVMTVSDQYGETQALTVTVMQGLQVVPQAVTFPDHTQPACQYPDGSTHNPCLVSVSKWGYNAPASYGINSSQCGAGAPVFAEASSSSGSIGANGASASTFTISPTLSAPNPCSMLVSDSVGEQVAVSVQVNDPPCPSGQPRDASGNCPTPAPTPAPLAQYEVDITYPQATIASDANGATCSFGDIYGNFVTLGPGVSPYGYGVSETVSGFLSKYYRSGTWVLNGAPAGAPYGSLSQWYGTLQPAYPAASGYVMITDLNQLLSVDPNANVGENASQSLVCNASYAPPAGGG